MALFNHGNANEDGLPVGAVQVLRPGRANADGWYINYQRDTVNKQILN